MAIKCFMLREIEGNLCKRYLRRMDLESKKGVCPENPWKIHDAEVYLDDGPVEKTPEGYLTSPNLPHDLPQWPKKCRCGYEFDDDDYWQVHVEVLYQTDTGERYTERDAPPGAMWNAWWMGAAGWTGPDGLCLMVKTPGGDWCVDGPSKNDDKPWQRTGQVPMVTARPSILIDGKYHGFLTNGELQEC